MKFRYLLARKFFLAGILSISVVMPGLQSLVGSEAKGYLAPLPLQLPVPTSKGTPDNLPEGPHVEKFTDKPRPAFMAPKGVKNVALGKKITCSVEKLYTG